MAGLLGKLFVSIGADVSGFDRALGHTERSMDKLAGRSRTATQTVGHSMDGMARSTQRSAHSMQSSMHGAQLSLAGFTQQAAAMASGLLIMSAVQGAFAGLSRVTFGFNAELEQSTTAFTTMLGSGEKAEAFLLQLARFAARTPFEFPDLVVATKRLMAFGIEAGQVMPLLASIGDAASAMGGGAEMIDRITRALGQMSAKGKVYAEEMLQLTEAGIPAWEMLAETMGVSVGQAMNTVQKDVVVAGTMIEAFQKGVAERFPQMMEKQSRTFAGAMSTIKDSLLMVGSTAFRPIFDRIGELALRIANFVASDRFEMWGSRVAAVIDVALDALGALARGFASGLGNVLNVVLGIGRQIYEALSWLNPFATHSPSLVESVTRGIDVIRTAYGSLSGTRRDLSGLTDAVEDFGNANRKVPDVVRPAERAVSELRNAVSRYRDELGRLAQVPIMGSKAFEDQGFAFDQQMAALQRRMNDIKLTFPVPESPRSPTGTPPPNVQAAYDQAEAAYRAAADRRAEALKPLEDQMEILRLQADNLRLDERLQLDPLRRQLREITSPTSERPFSDLAFDIGRARGEVERLTPQLGLAEDALEEIREITEEANRAASEAKAGAGGGIGAALTGGGKGLKLPDIDTSSLEQFKADVEATRAQIKAKFDEIATNIKNALQPVVATWDRIATAWKEGGVVGALKEVGEIAGEVGIWLGEQWSKIDWAKVWARVSGIGEAFAATVPPISAHVTTWLGNTYRGINWDAVWENAGRTAKSVDKAYADWMSRQSGYEAADAVYNWLTGVLFWGTSRAFDPTNLVALLAGIRMGGALAEYALLSPQSLIETYRVVDEFARRLVDRLWQSVRAGITERMPWAEGAFNFVFPPETFGGSTAPPQPFYGPERPYGPAAPAGGQPFNLTLVLPDSGSITASMLAEDPDSVQALARALERYSRRDEERR